MKRFTFLFVMLLITALTVTAQPPQAFKYKAIARDRNGHLIVNRKVAMRISLLQDSENGMAVYVETHTPWSNAFGVIELEIGRGTPVTGNFSMIDWGTGDYFIKVEMDLKNKPVKEYTVIGTSQLLSVPYALYAGHVQNSEDNDADPMNELITNAYLSGTMLTILEGGSTTLIDLSGLQDGVTDADADPTNEIQDISLAGTELSITGGSTVDLDGFLTSEIDPTWKGEADTMVTIGRIGRVGIGITAPAALLHTHGTGTGEGNVLFTGEAKSGPAIGDPPASGAGTRMMWYPDKAAFRAGYVNTLNWDKDSIGRFSVAMGDNTKAKGNASTAMGTITNASGYASTAMGLQTTASGAISTAMGLNTIASGGVSIAMGQITNASGTSATAMGGNTTASGWTSTAMGYYTTASGYVSTAMGNNTTAPSGYETVIGRYNTEYTPADATGWNTNDRLFVIGMGTGSGTLQKNAMTVVKNGNIGLGTDLPSALLHTHGTGTGEGNVLFVGSTKSSPGDPPASGAGTRMMWYPNKGAFRAGFVNGSNWDKDSIGRFSVAMGYNTKANGHQSVALGENTVAAGEQSFATGYYTQASAQRSTAMGCYSIASAHGSTAMGFDTEASGDGSTAMGKHSEATSYSSTAMGDHTVASGYYSTAMGQGTTASGASSTAMGQNTTASGSYSTAFGRRANADGDYSFAIHLSGTTLGMVVGANTFQISGASAIGGNLGWTNWSDRRLKKDIQLLNAENNIAKIMQLNGVRFRWNDNDSLLNLGFVAQDVLDIVPECVRYDKLNDIYSMEYTAIIPVLVEGIKEQQKIIEELKTRIEALENK